MFSGQGSCGRCGRMVDRLHLTMPFQISSSGLVNNVCYKNYFWPTPTGSLAYGVFNFVVQFVVPLFVIVFIYVRLFTFMRSKRRLATTALPPPPSASDLAARHSRLKIEDIILSAVKSE
jgi:hypothetical protein